MTDSLAPLIISTADLQRLLSDPDVLPVAVVAEKVFAAGHIPGSVLITPGELVSGIKPAVGKLPTAAHLSQLFSRIGLTRDKHIVAYDDEGGGWAGRLIWTLDVLGHDRCSFLDGGLNAWAGDGLPLTDTVTDVAPSTFEAHIDRQPIASLTEVMEQIPLSDSVVWDARAPEEYRGEKITAARNGHIPGAVNLDWLELMDRDNHLRLKPLDAIAARLAQLGITPDKSVITHCQTHHRSGLTYLVGKALGFNIRAYDGSWSEWGNDPDTPIEY